MGYFGKLKKEKEMPEAKKLTLADIQGKIKSTTFLQPVSTLTLCILTLQNGYTVTGKSACLNPADFDAEIGKKIAQENAEEKIWMLEGYLRKEAAFAGTKVDLPAVIVTPHDDMIAFIGTKIINAKPMTRADYTQFRGWQLPSDENGADEGYLVEYTDAQRPNVPGYQGFVSWSPKDVFEAAYHPLQPKADDAPAGEVLDEGVRLKAPDPATPLPFSG